MGVWCGAMGDSQRDALVTSRDNALAYIGNDTILLNSQIIARPLLSDIMLRYAGQGCMNRTDRLFAIILELQRRGTRNCHADDLARHFEVSKRTIYRDIQALCEVGVPIAVAGRQGYSLVEGYFLPPLRFTSDEALMLALGSEVIATNFDTEYRIAAESAYRKIDAVLTPALREQVGQLKAGLHFAATKPLESEPLRWLQILRQAVAAHRRIRIHYTKPEAASTDLIHTVREIDPYQLTRMANDWYLTGYCHLRQAIRLFRLARIEQAILLETTFSPTDSALLQQADQRHDQPIFVQARFAKSSARWAHESHQGMLIHEEATPDGVTMTLLTESVNDTLRWLLSWGSAVYVQEPAWIQAMLVEQAEQILQHYRFPAPED